MPRVNVHWESLDFTIFNMENNCFLTGQDYGSDPSLINPGSTVQHPAMLGLSPFEQAEVVLTGYRDCAAEAIRYLVEVEHFSMDDPIVLGLRKHLYEQQRALNVHRILSNLENNPYFVSDTENSRLDDSGFGDNSFVGNVNDTNMEAHARYESDSEAEPSETISNTVPHEVDHSAIVSLAEEILTLIELGETPEPEVEEEEIDDEEM